MNGIFAIVLLGLLGVVAAYDFNDEDYNQLIKQDLDDLESIYDTPDFLTNVHRRKREDEPTTAASADKCKKRRWRMCCGEESFERIMERDREIKKDCFKDVMARMKDEGKDKPATGVYDPFSCEKIQKVKKEWACVVECVGRKKEIIDEEGNLVEDDLLDFYKKELGQDEWLYKLVVAAYPKCLENAKSGVSFVRDKEDPLSCNPVPIRMHHCMWRELQLTCPDDKVSDVKLCSKIREKIKRNDYLPFRHHQHDDD